MQNFHTTHIILHVEHVRTKINAGMCDVVVVIVCVNATISMRVVYDRFISIVEIVVVETDVDTVCVVWCVCVGSVVGRVGGVVGIVVFVVVVTIVVLVR